MCTSSPDAPAPPPVLPEAPTAPKSAMRGRGRNKRRQAASTLLTSPRGVTEAAPTDQKTLLGA